MTRCFNNLKVSGHPLYITKSGLITISLVLKVLFDKIISYPGGELGLLTWKKARFKQSFIHYQPRNLWGIPKWQKILIEIYLELNFSNKTNSALEAKTDLRRDFISFLGRNYLIFWYFMIFSSGKFCLNLLEHPINCQISSQYKSIFLRSIAQFFTQIYIHELFCQFISWTN